MTAYPFPLRLRLAADPRFVETSLDNDHIWRLTAGDGDPACISVETSYGLRAHQLRIFPSFRWRGRSRLDPAEFVEPLVVDAMFPNYARLHFVPFVDLRVSLEYWVVDSQRLAGRITLGNLAGSPEEHQLRLHAQLRPLKGGQPMAALEYRGVEVLQGNSDSLKPLLFLSGGAVAERVAIPALRITNRLPAGEQASLFWATSATAQPEKAFEQLRSLAESRWQAEIARIELANQGLLEVETGQPAWDFAFARSQQVGLGLAVSGSTYLPATSFVVSRSPDHGHSDSKSGRDQPETWDGQDVYAAFQLAGQWLPAAPELVQAALRNYFHGQVARGEIDGRPGLRGQKAKYNAPPLLATLAWRAFMRTGSESFLRELYSPLMEFLSSWFSKTHDKDADGAPEWQHLLQTGMPELPTIVRWSNWGEAIDLSTLEPPDLLTYLLAECQSLMRMADHLGRSEDLPKLETRATRLRQCLARAWSPDQGMYLPLDRDLDLPLQGKRLAKGKGSFSKKVGKKFDPMVRLVVRIQGPENEAKSLSLTIHGRGPKGQFRKERVEGKDISWFWDFGSATTANTFASIERIECSASSKKLSTEVAVVNHHRPDASRLLPIYVNQPGEEKNEELAANIMSDRFLRPHGLASIPSDDPIYGETEHLSAWGVRVGLNELIGLGLLQAGQRQRAADLVMRLMEGITAQLSSEGVFRAVYHPEQNAAAGERDAAFGLAPLDLFLKVLGIGLESPWSVRVEGENAFPWPVTLRWSGLTVHRPLEGCGWVQFPDGDKVEIKDASPSRISRER
jgi:hypothetical protein